MQVSTIHLFCPSDDEEALGAHCSCHEPHVIKKSLLIMVRMMMMLLIIKMMVIMINMVVVMMRKKTMRPFSP